MTELTDPRWLRVKGLLLLFTAVFAATLLIRRLPDWETVLLLGITVWSACRAYYFAFYVIQQYVDPTFRFAGLGALVIYLWKGGRRPG